MTTSSLRPRAEATTRIICNGSVRPVITQKREESGPKPQPRKVDSRDDGARSFKSTGAACFGVGRRRCGGEAHRCRLSADRPSVGRHQLKECLRESSALHQARSDCPLICCPSTPGVCVAIDRGFHEHLPACPCCQINLPARRWCWRSGYFPSVNSPESPEAESGAIHTSNLPGSANSLPWAL